MNQKQIKDKLEALNHKGCLMMLTDFLNEWYNNPNIQQDEESYISRGVATIAARLKVQYMNDIVPIEKSTQIDIENAIEIVKSENKKKSKTKKK